MIESLTPEQEARFPEFMEKWSQIALSTAPADRPKAERGVRAIYETAGLKPPKIVWCTSPLVSGLTRAIIQRFTRLANPGYSSWEMIDRQSSKAVIDRLWASIKDSVNKSVGDRVWHSVIASIEESAGARIDHIGAGVLYIAGENVRGSVRDQVWGEVNARVRKSAGFNVWYAVTGVPIYKEDELDDSHVMSPLRLLEEFPGESIKPRIGNVVAGVEAIVETSVKVTSLDIARDSESDWETAGGFDIFVGVRRKGKLGESVEDSVGASVIASVKHSGHGQYEAGFLIDFDYFRSVCGLVKETEPLIGHWEQAQAAGWYLPHEHICWVSERPNILHLNKRNQLHCETGPALAYPDSLAIYALNGVLMKAEYIITPAEQMDPRTILKERNVDIRRELLRKVGVSRMLKFGKEIDHQGSYKLIDMSRLFKGFEIHYAPYLLMESPSVDGAQHLEGVSPDCRTVGQAINWRASEVAKNWNPDLLS